MNVHDSGKDEDTISRHDAIDILNEQIKQCDKALDSFDISRRDEYAIKVERASLIAYREQLEALPPAQPNPTIVRVISRFTEDGKEYAMAIVEIEGEQG